MKSYITTFKLNFMNNIQYRVAAIAGIATQFFFGFVFIFVFVAFYNSSSGNPPMTMEQVVSYLWLNQSFFSLIYIWDKDKNLLQMIRNGNICYELCRPQTLYFKWYATIYGKKLANVLLRFLPIIIISLLLPEPYNLMLPSSFTVLIVSFVSLIIGAFLVTAICLLIHLVTFFTIDEKGIITLLSVVGEILSGGVVPIPFFPKFLQTIANILPFRYISDLPFRIYVGSISLKESFISISIQLLWLIVLVIGSYFLTKTITKKVIVQGG